MAAHPVAVGEVELPEEVAVEGDGLEPVGGELLTVAEVQRLQQGHRRAHVLAGGGREGHSSLCSYCSTTRLGVPAAHRL